MWLLFQNEVHSEMFLIQNYMPIRYIINSINSREENYFLIFKFRLQCFVTTVLLVGGHQHLQAPMAYIQAFARSYSFWKGAENSSFWTFLIYQLRLLGSQQHLRSGVLLPSFSSWGTENSPAEINLGSTRGDKGF